MLKPDLNIAAAASRALSSRSSKPFLQTTHHLARRRQSLSSSKLQRRPFSTTQTRCQRFRTVEQAKTHHRLGPFSIWSALFFIASGGGIYWYFQSEKERLARKRTREASKGYGRARIGGEFDLIDQDGKPFTSEDIKGKFSLIYFGFTNCPDICPDELDKMAKMIDTVKAKRGKVLKPIFVTCDPNRDTPPVVKEYLSEFHPEIIGLTGEYEKVRAMCKAYRVYWSTPPHVKAGQDYLVDHSIYFYLMDPDGDFIEVVGRQHTANQGAKLINDHIDKMLGRKVTDDSWKDVKPIDAETLVRA